MALVLAPNAALCRQVTAAATTLKGPDGMPLLRAAYLASATPPPHGRLDIAVATPGDCLLRVSQNDEKLIKGPLLRAVHLLSFTLHGRLDVAVATPGGGLPQRLCFALSFHRLINLY